MTWLELKIPPPIVALLCAIGMVVLPDLFGLEAFEVPFQGWAAGLVIVFGLSFDLLGLIEFRRHATTINPLSPNKSSQIVSSLEFIDSRATPCTSVWQSSLLA